MKETAVDGFTAGRSTSPAPLVALHYLGLDVYGDLPMNGRKI